jgi:hypothetical protein
LDKEAAELMKAMMAAVKNALHMAKIPPDLQEQKDVVVEMIDKELVELEKTREALEVSDKGLQNLITAQMSATNTILVDQEATAADLRDELEKAHELVEDNEIDHEEEEVDVVQVDIVIEAREIELRPHMKSFSSIQKSLGYLPSFVSSSSSPHALGNRLIAWFRELELQMVITAVIHPRTLDILGSKFPGVMSSRHRIALPIDTVAEARRVATRLHRALHPKLGFKKR